MLTAVIPSRTLIVIAAVGAAVCTAVAFTAIAAPIDAASVIAIPTVSAPVVEVVTLAIGVLLFALCVLDLLLSIRDWRRAPLEIRRQLPHAFAIGVPVTVQVSIDNHGDTRRLGQFQEYADPTLLMPQLPLPFDIGPRRRELLNIELTPTARGLQRFDPGQVRLRSRLGLLDLDLRLGPSESRRVFPNFQEQARFAWLAGDRRLQSTGLKSVQRRGSGTDFDQLIDYQAGDPIRHIDWKATEKHDRPIVRKFQDERDQDVIILLDCGRRMRADDTQHGIGATHFDQCLNALMLLAFVALSHGDAVGAMTFGIADGAQKTFAPRKGKQTLNALMAALADVEATATFSDYERIAAECVTQRRKRGLVVMITNTRNEDAPQLGAALALLRTRHIVILANLREEIVSLITDQPLTNPESALECAAALEYTQSRDRLLRRFTQGGVLTIDCEPQRLGVELVNRYRALKRSGSI
jgi:uncharacterized protein (DUF58 family)